jgi:carboxyl-terminal processing protease
MYKNSHFTVLMPFVVACSIAAGIFLGRVLERSSTESDINGILRTLTLPENKVSEALSIIDSEYVDSVDIDQIAEELMPAIFTQLDPHSVYIPASEMKELNEPLEGEFDGIGVVFNMATDTVIVLNVVSGGPSDKAGILSGDRIIRVNDTLIAGQKLSQNDVMRRLRGPRGTEVQLGVQRRGIDDLVDITVVRDKIPIRSLTVSMMLDDHTALVRLDQFSRTSYAEMVRALRNLRAEGMRNLILDLRGNGGGFLDQAIAIANEFLPKESLIVYTEDRKHERVNQYSDGSGVFTDLKLAVLIDEGSASSSEILAGALQDNDRGTIIGRRSFGKGLVQQQIPFSDGSAMRLTVARYYTPTGRSIQKPYTPGNDESYEADLWNRFAHNEFFVADSIHFADSLRYVTPAGKVVYGGGGIMPDIFVPLDTTAVTHYYAEVSGRNILYRYTIEYADTHREALKAVRSLSDLKTLLDADTSLVDDFVRYAQRQGVAPRYNDIARSRELMEAQLKAFIGRNTVLEDNGYYLSIYPEDNVIMRALDVLNQENQEP